MKNAVDEIRRRYEAAGLRVVRERTVHMQEFRARDLYQGHKGRVYLEGLVLSMIAGPCVVFELEGEGAVDRVRALNGATNPVEAEPGTIRHDIRSAGGPFNTVHGSDSPEAAERELAIAFAGTS